jgi:hypothetical protein
VLPYSNCVHYDAEPARREEYHRAVAEGMSAGFAVEDGVGLHFRGTQLERVVSSRPGGRAFMVRRHGASVREAPLEAEYLGASGPARAQPAASRAPVRVRVAA